MHYSKVLRQEFAATGLDGEIGDFFDDMPAMFAQAHLVICRSGAGAISELAAAGKPSILIPFPYAADDHQRKNAESFAQAGAARLYLDKDWTGPQLFDTVSAFMADSSLLNNMARAAKALGKPGAAARAADILENIH